MKKRIFSILVAFVLCFGIFAGCKGDEYTGVGDDVGEKKFHKYSSELKLKVGQWVSDETMYPAGQSASNNVMYDLIKEHLNIDLEPAFEAKAGQSYFTQMGTLQSIDSLPDMGAMDTSILYDAIEAEQLEDLKPYLDKHASPALKRILGSRNGEYLKVATKDGKVYGLPKITDKFNGIPVVWLRKDWLKTAGIIPEYNSDFTLESYEQFVEILEAFKNNKSAIESSTNVTNSYPYAMYKSLNHPFTSLMNAQSSYPGLFIKDANNNYAFASTQNETYEALKEVSELNAKYMRTDWATQEITQIATDSSTGKVGVFVDEFWGSLATQIFGVMQSKFLSNDATIKDGFKDADWVAVPMPAADGGLITPQVTAQASEYYYIHKGYPNPEALIFMMNAMAEKYSTDAEKALLTAEDAAGLNAYVNEFAALSEAPEYVSKMIYGWLPFFVDDPDKNQTYMTQICDALSGKITGESLTGEMLMYYNIIKTGSKTGVPSTDPEERKRELFSQWQWGMVYGPNGGIKAASMYTDFKYNAYAGAPTNTMKTSTSTLNKYENTTFINYVTGKVGLDSSTVGFNGSKGFVTSYLSQGGTKILSELGLL